MKADSPGRKQNSRAQKGLIEERLGRADDLLGKIKEAEDSDLVWQNRQEAEKKKKEEADRFGARTEELRQELTELADVEVQLTEKKHALGEAGEIRQALQNLRAALHKQEDLEKEAGSLQNKAEKLDQKIREQRETISLLKEKIADRRNAEADLEAAKNDLARTRERAAALEELERKEKLFETESQTLSGLDEARQEIRSSFPISPALSADPFIIPRPAGWRRTFPARKRSNRLPKSVTGTTRHTRRQRKALPHSRKRSTP